MLRKREHYQHCLQREKRTMWWPRNSTDSARKTLNGARDIFLIHNTISRRSLYDRWPKKEQELSFIPYNLQSNFTSKSMHRGSPKLHKINYFNIFIDTSLWMINLSMEYELKCFFNTSRKKCLKSLGIKTHSQFWIILA